MLAHAHLRHGGVGGSAEKSALFRSSDLLQRLLRQLKIFHVAGLSGALEKRGAQSRVSSRILGIALHPALHGLIDALGTGGARNQQRGRHRREHNRRDGCRGYGSRRVIGCEATVGSGRGAGFACRVNDTHARPVLERLRIAGKKFVGTLQHLAGGIQLAHVDLDGCDAVGDRGQLAGLAGRYFRVSAIE